MRRGLRVIVAVAILLAGAGRAAGMAGEDEHLGDVGEQVVKEKRWPAGVREVMNDRRRVRWYTFWFSELPNDVDTFVFRGESMEDVNALVGKLAGVAGARVELIGLCGVDRRDLDETYIRTLPPREPRTLRIVLSHFPDHFRLTKPLAADFFLSGHTHGGQVCLPGGWPLITHDRMPKKYAKGIHRFGPTWYVVSRGLGYASFPIRVHCPAEVAEITTVSVPSL